MMDQPGRVSIIGVGLIGGSIGLALKERWPTIQVTGFDASQETLDGALSSGLIDKAASDAADACKEAEFIFIATPVSTIPALLEEIAPAIGPDAIVTDAGSTKATIVKAAERSLSPSTSFIGGHPMAGSDQGGFRSASAGLLNEAVYVLTPTPSTKPEVFQKLHSLLTKLGARVMALGPEKHDEVVAAVSHLPHVLAAALVNLAAAYEEGVENRLFFAAGGFRDTTRIAASNPNLWVDICLDNGKAISASIEKYISSLESAKQLIDEGDREGLVKLLSLAKRRRASMSIGAPSTAIMRDLDILVTDSPGTISKITKTFGQLGINIEDIDIIHLSGDRGVIKLLVNDNPDIEKAVVQLRDHGFDVIL